MIFPSQKPYEKVEAILRRHRIVLFFLFLYSGILAIFGFGVYYLAEYYLNLSSLGFHEFARLILMAYLLMLWQSFFRGLMDYYLDTWIITDHRVIDIHQIGLFKRDISELRYTKIQDISVKMTGFWATMLNYGDIVIQTAGAVQEFKFHQVPNPNKVKDSILQMHDQFTRDHPDGVEVHDGVSMLISQKIVNN